MNELENEPGIRDPVLDRTARQAKSSGGLDSYEYDSQLVSDFLRGCMSDAESVDSRGNRRNKRNQRLRGYSCDRTRKTSPSCSHAAAAGVATITTGMISVSVGLACAENVLYLFFLGGTGRDIGKISMELAILLLRSPSFPCTPTLWPCRASTFNMIARNIRVGHIIFPAVLLRGIFDAHSHVRERMAAPMMMPPL